MEDIFTKKIQFKTLNLYSSRSNKELEDKIKHFFWLKYSYPKIIYKLAIASIGIDVARKVLKETRL